MHIISTEDDNSQQYDRKLLHVTPNSEMRLILLILICSHITSTLQQHFTPNQSDRKIIRHFTTYLQSDRGSTNSLSLAKNDLRIKASRS